MVVILIVAAVVSAALGDYEDTAVILAIVVLNAILGFTQEYRAERAIAALKRLAVPTVRVRRGGHVQEISARELVPGDIVLLEAGALVPADGRLIEGINLRVQESALTDELAALCRIARDSCVLDAGCGVGMTPCYLAQAVGCRVVGVDISERMIAWARRRAQRARLGDRVTFAVADAQHLSFDV